MCCCSTCALIAFGAQVVLGIFYKRFIDLLIVSQADRPI